MIVAWIWLALALVFLAGDARAVPTYFGGPVYADAVPLALVVGFETPSP